MSSKVMAIEVVGEEREDRTRHFIALHGNCKEWKFQYLLFLKESGGFQIITLLTGAGDLREVLNDAKPLRLATPRETLE